MDHRGVLRDVYQTLDEYFSRLPARGVGVAPAPLELAAKLDFSLAGPAASEAQLVQFMRSYLDSAVGTLHPQFMNQLFSGLRPWALAGEALAAATNTTMATFEASPVATMMERSLVAQLASYAGWSERHDGIMVTGGSNANLVGMLMARNRLHPEIRDTGTSARPLVAFVSEEAHYSFEKAANIMGLGKRNLRTVAADESGRLDVGALRRAIAASKAQDEAPFFIGATAGTTVLGEYDPLDEIAAVARAEKLWFHVDGAWGGGALVSRTHRHLMAGIEHADSLGWDTHKMLGTGLVSSFFLTPHQGALRQSHAGGGADYIFHASEAGSWDLGPSSLQCGRRADAVKAWFAWRSLGPEGMSQLVDQLFSNAQTAARLIQETPGLELLSAPRSLNVCFRVARSSEMTSLDWHRGLRERMMKQGKGMVNIATRKGESFIRLITAHPEQDEAFLRQFLGDLLDCARAFRP